MTPTKKDMLPQPNKLKEHQIAYESKLYAKLLFKLKLKNEEKNTRLKKNLRYYKLRLTTELPPRF